MDTEEHHVFFTAGPGMSLRETMAELGPWLEDNDITPISVRHTITPSGQVEVQLTFSTRRDASLFEHAFCDIDNVA